jgi:hypothetical protein
MHGRLNLLVVQQQPQLEARNRGNRAKSDRLSSLITEPAIQRFGQPQRLDITWMIIPIKNGEYSLKGTPRDPSMTITMFE